MPVPEETVPDTLNIDETPAPSDSSSDNSVDDSQMQPEEMITSPTDSTQNEEQNP